MSFLGGRLVADRRSAFGGLLVLAFSAGCAPVYVAPAANAPLFGSAGEATVGAALGTQGIDVHGGYAPVDHFAAVAAVSYEGEGGDDSVDHHHLYGEAGLGGFWPFGKGGRFEAFAGLGYGSSGGETVVLLGGEEEVVASAGGTFLRPYVQLDLGGALENFEGALVLRVVQVRYHYDESGGESVDVNRNQGFWEPLGVLRAGSKHVKIQLQGGLVLPFDTLGGNSELAFIDWVPFHLSLGVHARFGGTGAEPKPLQK